MCNRIYFAKHSQIERFCMGNVSQNTVSKPGVKQSAMNFVRKLVNSVY